MYFQRLKDLREDCDLTQKEIADLLGTTQSYYGQYERGEKDIPIERLIKLAKYYNVSLDYLTGLITNKRPLYENKTPVKKH